MAAFCICLGTGLPGFATLFAVFVLTWIATRVGRQRKQELELAENRHGRNAGQVLANVGAAAIFSLLALWHGEFIIAAVAAMAEAAADTASSEIGEALAQRAWIITSFRAVAPGTDGGVSFPGTLAGAIAAVATCSVALGSRLLDLPHAALAVAAGFAGTIVDSLLGATAERKGKLNNDQVNFLSTVATGLIALGLTHV